MTICDEPECDRTDVVGRGLCSRHYQAHKLRGDLDEVAPKYRTLTCPQCGNDFEAQRYFTDYCSSTCRGKAKNAKAHPRQHEACLQCGGSMEHRQSDAKFCSETCSIAERTARLSAEKLAAKGNCSYCNEKLSMYRRDYCSDECKSLARRAVVYSLTQAELRDLLTQHPACDICGTTTWGKKGPAVDHDHETGAVRGVLCQFCNIGLGHFRDNAGLIRKAVTYLEHHQVTV